MDPACDGLGLSGFSFESVGCGVRIGGFLSVTSGEPLLMKVRLRFPQRVCARLNR